MRIQKTHILFLLCLLGIVVGMGGMVSAINIKVTDNNAYTWIKSNSNITLNTYNQTWLNFNGSATVNIPDSDVLSPSVYGNQTTISFWVYMNNYSFTGQSSDAEYTNYFGKTTYDPSNNCEWEFRMENATGMDGTSPRPCRFSFYAFNKTCGVGAGSYFQDNNTATGCTTENNTWINVVGRINGTYISIWKNGVIRDTDPLSNYGINLTNTLANIHIGTDIDGGQWNGGQIDDIRIYNTSLGSTDILAIYTSGRNNNTVLNSSNLVAQYKLNENQGTTAFDSVSGNNGTITGARWQNDGITIANLLNFPSLDIANNLILHPLSLLYNYLVSYSVPETTYLQLNLTDPNPTHTYILQISNLTNALGYTRVDTELTTCNSFSSNIQDNNGNINMLMTVDSNKCTILNYYNLTEGISRQYSPIWFSSSTSASKHITSNVSSSINASVITNLGDCYDKLTYTSGLGSVTQYTGSNVKSKCEELKSSGLIFQIDFGSSNTLTWGSESKTSSTNSCNTGVSAFAGYAVLLGLVGVMFFMGLIIVSLTGIIDKDTAFKVGAVGGIATIILIGILIIVATVTLSSLCVLF